MIQVCSVCSKATSNDLYLRRQQRGYETTSTDAFLAALDDRTLMGRLMNSRFRGQHQGCRAYDYVR